TSETIGEKLPKGFQRAEFVLDHGFVDQVVPRAQLRERIAYFLNAFRPSARDLRWSLWMDVVDRFLGKKVAAEGNGHIPEDAGLITDTAMLGAQRTPWQSVQLARELKRPHAIEVMDGLFEKFQELHGDRGYRDDPAVVGGIAELEVVGPVVVVAQQRGATTEEN